MPEPAKIVLNRNHVMINTAGVPPVCSAQENVSWPGGNVMIVGIGKSRAEALVAVDAQFENLKKVLGIS